MYSNMHDACFARGGFDHRNTSSSLKSIPKLNIPVHMKSNEKNIHLGQCFATDIRLANYMVIINYHGWIIMFCSQLFCLKIGMNESPFIRFASKEMDILICPLSNLSWSYQQCMSPCHHVSHSGSLCPSKWLLKTSVFHVCVLYLNCKTPQFEVKKHLVSFPSCFME